MVASRIFSDTHSVQAPATHAELVDISAADHTFTHPIRGISFGTAGTLKVDTQGGETVAIPSGALGAGAIHPLRITKVYKTGTSAADMVGYW